MFNLIINFSRIIRDNLAAKLRQPIRINGLKAMVKPFRTIYSDFMQVYADLKFKVRFNGATIYLETALNDRFDPVNRAIFISEFDFEKVYIYKKSELKPAIVLYKKWDATINYVTGQFAWMTGNLVYEANTNNINKTPGVDPEWTLTTRKAPVLRKAENFNGVIAFVVNVPASLIFDQEEMRATIAYWKLSGPGYIIVTF